MALTLTLLGYTGNEIGEIMGRNEGAVEALLVRARSRAHSTSDRISDVLELHSTY